MDLSNIKIGIIGLGYVGLPLAVEFSKIKKVIGYDINSKRIKELKNYIDLTKEVSSKDLKKSKKLILTDDIKNLIDCNCFIVTVPTPINSNKKPNLKPLFLASQLVGKILKKNDIVIYESTVYPGVTEEECSKILEKFSKLRFNKDFFLGYSPERINPGDKKHKIQDIVKITSGSNKKTSKFVDRLYKSIIKAGTYNVNSIEIAEAAKVIENTKRDVNIALINELSIIFNKLNIDTEEVLNAAGTKWNFLPFRPGLVGGHCIGIDPYYLTYKARKINYNPKIILAGRKINDQMRFYVVKKLLNLMKKRKMLVKKSRILIMGITFKENCPDIRNSKVIEIANSLSSKGAIVNCYDPWVAKQRYNQLKKIKIISDLKKNYYDCIILAVAHKKIIKIGISKIRTFVKPKNIIYDLKHIFPSSKTDIRL